MKFAALPAVVVTKQRRNNFRIVEELPVFHSCGSNPFKTVNQGTCCDQMKDGEYRADRQSISPVSQDLLFVAIVLGRDCLLAGGDK